MGDYFKTFREQIVNILKEKGLKQKDLAEMLGVDKSNISQLFSGVRRFNEETIEAICRVLNVSPMKLFSGNKPVPPVIKRIEQYYSIDVYRKGIEYWEEELYQGCVRNGLIDPEKNDTEP